MFEWNSILSHPRINLVTGCISITFRYLHIPPMCPRHGCNCASPEAQRSNPEGLLLFLSRPSHSSRWVLGPGQPCYRCFGSVGPCRIPVACTPPSRRGGSSLFCTRCSTGPHAALPLAPCKAQGHQPAAHFLGLERKSCLGLQRKKRKCLLPASIW